MAVNFMATVHLVRAFVPRLLEAGEPAQLLVTGSMAAVTARAGISPLGGGELVDLRRRHGDGAPVALRRYPGHDHPFPAASGPVWPGGM